MLSPVDPCGVSVVARLWLTWLMNTMADLYMVVVELAVEGDGVLADTHGET